MVHEWIIGGKHPNAVSMGKEQAEIQITHQPAAARLPPGQFTGYCADCDVDCDRDYQVNCEPSRQLWCGHSSASCGTLPANCPDTSRQFLGNGPDTARMIRRKLNRTFAGNCPPVAGTMTGYCPANSLDTARRLPG
jgi:hypothetical protein